MRYPALSCLPLLLMSVSAFAEDVVSGTAIQAPLVVDAPDLARIEPAQGPRRVSETLLLASQHPQVALRSAQIEQAQGTLQANRASRWFTLTGDAAGGVETIHTDTNDDSHGVGEAGLSLVQPLLDGGRRRAAVRGAEASLEGASDNLAWEQRQRRYTAADAHIRVWLAEALARTNQANLDDLVRIAATTQARLKAGEATSTEMAEAESRVASAKAAQAERVTVLESARADYLREVGAPAGPLAEPEIAALDAMLATPSNTLVHPLVTAAAQTVAAADATLKQRNAGYWPTLDLRGRAQHDAFDGLNYDDATSSGRLTLNLGYTFIDNGAVAGEVASARGALKASQADLTFAKLDVEAAYLAARARATHAHEQLTQSEEAVKQSGTVVDNLRREVAQGNRPLRDLLDARRDELNALGAYLQAQAGVALAGYDLERWR